MKKIITKKQIRLDLEQQVNEFLHQGGDVQQIKRGVSGRHPGDPPLKASNSFFSKAREERTYLPEVVAALEARRQEKSGKTKAKPPTASKPRKKMIYDDFGEPLRWEWVDE
jgi:hypothetical protein